MDRISLLILPAATPIRKALAMMRAAEKSAVVTVIGGRKVVVEARDLLAQGETPSLPIGKVVPERTTSWHPPGPAADLQAAAMTFDGQQAAFAITLARDGVAVVVARTADIAAAMMGAPGYYRCKGGHLRENPPLDGLCRIDKFPFKFVGTL